jgi:hypothetical protein
LAARHPIDAVVYDNGSKIDIPPGGVNEMIPSDGDRVAIAHDDDHLQIGFGQLHPGGKGKGPAMGGVKGIEIHIDRESSRTTDSGNQNDLILIEPGPVDRPDQGSQHDPDPAPWAPDMGKLLVMTKIFMDEFSHFCHQKSP